MGKIAKNYLYNIAYQIFILIVPLLTAPYLTRTLGATNMGTYSYISSYASIISTLSLLGIYNYGVRQLAYIRDDEVEFNRTFWEINLLRFMLAIGGTICYFAISKNKYSDMILLYYPWMLAGYIDLSWLFVAVEDMGPAVMKNFIAKLLSVIAIFIFIKSKNQLWIYILILSVSSLIANVSLFPQVIKYVSRPQFDIKSLKKHLAGTIVLFLPQIASLLYMQIDKVMLESITGNLEQISFYDQAEKIVKIPMTFITVISTIMMPRIANEYSRGDSQKIELYLTTISRLSLALALPMIFGMISIARQFIPWYLGAEYQPTAVAIVIISPIILSNAMMGISGSQYFIATNKVKIVIWSNLIGAMLNILANILLIPNYSFMGSAVASVMATYSIVIIQYFKLNKEIKVVRLLRSFPKYFVNSLTMAICVYFITCKMPIAPLTTLIQIVIGGGIYIILLFIERDLLLMGVLGYLKRKITMR